MQSVFWRCEEVSAWTKRSKEKQLTLHFCQRHVVSDDRDSAFFFVCDGGGCVRVKNERKNVPGGWMAMQRPPGHAMPYAVPCRACSVFADIVGWPTVLARGRATFAFWVWTKGDGV